MCNNAHDIKIAKKIPNGYSLYELIADVSSKVNITWIPAWIIKLILEYDYFSTNDEELQR